MNNKQRLAFIEKNHPELYRLLEMTAQYAIDNTDFMNSADAETCNEAVDYYCKTRNITDPELIKFLKFKVD